MNIEINSLRYQCWHELGHAVSCLHFGGNVEFIELIDIEKPGVAARARCATTPNIRQNVACGGFAVEFFLLRRGFLGDVDEREITQVLFRNASNDREMFHGVSGDYEFSEAEDRIFMNHAIKIVVPIFSIHLNGMKELVEEMLNNRRIDGSTIRSALLL